MKTLSPSCLGSFGTMFHSQTHRCEGTTLSSKAPQSPPRHRGGLVEDAPVLVLGLCLQQQSCCNPSVRMRCEEKIRCPVHAPPGARAVLRPSQRNNSTNTKCGLGPPMAHRLLGPRWRSLGFMSLRLKVRMVSSYVFVPCGRSNKPMRMPLAMHTRFRKGV